MNTEDSFDQLYQEFMSTPEGRDLMDRGRQWVEEHFYQAVEDNNRQHSLIYLQHNIMKTALEQIAGTRAIIDNLLSDKDIATITLERISKQNEYSTSIRPPP